MISLPKFDPGASYWLSGKTLNQICDAIRERTPLAGKNIRIGRTTPQGVVLNAEGGGAAGEVCPFAAESGSTAGQVTFTSLGHINGVVPSNLFGSGGFLTVTVPASGLGYIVIAVEASNGGVQSATITTRGSSPAPALPTLGAPPENFDVLLYVTLNGVPFRVIACGNLAANPAIVAAVDKSTPACGGLPSDYYYQWQTEAV